MFGSAEFWTGTASKVLEVVSLVKHPAHPPARNPKQRLIGVAQIQHLVSVSISMNRNACLTFFLFCLFLNFAACAPQARKTNPIAEQDLLAGGPDKSKDRSHLQNEFDVSDPASSLNGLATGQTKPPTPEQVQPQLESAVHKWFYGPGFGRTALNVGTIVLFPPYALYLLANAGIGMAGFEPLYITDVLPEEPRAGVLEVYDNVTYTPGRVHAFIAGEEFQDTAHNSDQGETEK